MKSKILTLTLLALLFSCNKKEEKIEPVPVPEITQPAPVVAEKTCYLWTQGKDSIKMSLAMNGNNANGELAYNFFEKDKSKGTFSGVFIGDTLFADYNFDSEGMNSVRQIAFIRKGEAMIQGFGDVEVKDNREVFKNAKALKFDGSVALAKAACK